MPPPFSVGKHYRNRDGQYEVISIDGPRMKVRYKNGQIADLDIASQARIWERIQEEESFGAEDLDVDFMDEGSSNSSRRTDEIKTFVSEILAEIPQPWPPDVTDQVFLNIERNPQRLANYNRLLKEFDNTVNNAIGMYVKELTQLENGGRGTPKSSLIKSYTILVPPQ